MAWDASQGQNKAAHNLFQIIRQANTCWPLWAFQSQETNFEKKYSLCIFFYAYFNFVYFSCNLNTKKGIFFIGYFAFYNCFLLVW